ncbi:hypothetical protein [Dermatobacter hominis]|uniref:hypothetical protein n=1 Tax=Dermatobacter hominis TaxID=2884263 RepID=UPI001D104BB1|nr:hypothetical protein [Dermatobacter hominis]UDY34553.1 hypothetical protein LH044_14565 [Dermatobacter hominis]
MHIAKEDIPVVLQVPGAIARQLDGFGEVPGLGSMAGEWFSLGAGTDIAPLLQGLEKDLCAAPHWGYLTSGELVITYADRAEEKIAGGSLFYWPPHHSVRVTEDAEVILFSPHAAHRAVVDHMAEKLGAAG